jgi:hypothetical protein
LYPKLLKMKKHLFTLFLIGLVGTTACKKEKIEIPPAPLPTPEVEMVYTNLNNAEVKYMQPGVWIDLNKDNRADVLFEVMRVGDHINRYDRFLYNIVTSIRVNVPVNINEQIPVFLKNATIPLENFDGINWYGGSEIDLIQKALFENGSVSWRGNWLTAERAYLPVQIIIEGKRHNGWIELTADTQNERLIIHRAAISKEAEKQIKAGF